MKLKTTVYQGHDLEWNIIVSPNKDTQKEDIDIFRRWTPPGEQNAKVLIYSPKIAMVPSMVMRKGMSFADFNREKDTRAYMAIPIDHIYIFINVLQQVYKDLSNPKLFIKDTSGYIYMDKQTAKECSRKVKLFNGDAVISPAIFAFNAGEIIGVTITYKGTLVGSMTHKEVRKLCELVNHMDIQVYSLLLNMVEQNLDISDKLDRMSEDIRDIRNFLSMLSGKDINKFSAMQRALEQQQQQQASVINQFQWNNLPLNRQGEII